jgi:predicted exporter
MRTLRLYWFFLLLPVLISIAFFTTQFKTDISSFFIAGKNAQEVLLANEIQSGVLSRRYLVAVGSDNKAPSADFITALMTELKTINGVSGVWKAEEKRGVLEAVNALYAQQGANLYSRQPQTDLAKILSPEGLAERAKALKAALLSPQGETVEKIAAADPLLLVFNGLAEQPERFFQAGKTLATYENLIVETQMSGMDVPAQAQIQQQIQAVFAAQQAKFAQAVKLEMTGVPVFAAATQTRMQHEITLISIVSSLALAGLFFWLFKSLRVLFWVSSLLITVVCAAVIVTNLVFGFVHGMTLAIGTTLIGICIDYPIHALVHGHAAPPEQRLQTVAKIFPSMLLGGATTLIGYFALGLSGYPGFQQVAVYAAVGILVSLLLTRYLLPRLMTGEIVAASGAKPVTTWLTFCQRFRPRLLTGLAILAVFSIVPLSSLNWMQDLQELTPEMEELKANDAKIRARLVSLEPGRFVLVSGDHLEQALQHSEQVYQILDTLKSKAELKDYFGLYPWLLSQQQQQQNRQRLKAALTPQVLQLWQKNLTAQGLSVPHLGQLNYPPQPEVTVQQILATPLGRLMENQLIKQRRKNVSDYLVSRT